MSPPFSLFSPPSLSSSSSSPPIVAAPFIWSPSPHLFSLLPHPFAPPASLLKSRSLPFCHATSPYISCYCICRLHSNRFSSMPIGSGDAVPGLSSPFSSPSPSSTGSQDGVGEEIADEDGCGDTDDEDELVIVDRVASRLPERWDVLGLGQAMVDFSGIVDDKFLARLGLEKGARKVVNHEERGRVLRAMDGCSYKAAAGGSLSNSLVALARLGGEAIGGPALNVAMAGSVGSDPLGGFYR